MITKRLIPILAMLMVAAASLVPGAFAAKRATVTSVVEAYGADPLQVVTVTRNTAATGRQPTVIFLHGGGWNAGGRGSLDAEAHRFADNGWVSVNVSYRLGVAKDDGKLILADVLAVLAKYRAKAYVDPAKIIVYGESAGGHLATWLGAFKGAQIAGTVAISPVSSISNAITAGLEPGAPDNVRNLGARASLYFGYSVGTTDADRYVGRAQAMLLIGSANEWVSWDIHGAQLCALLGARCTSTVYPGTLHAGALVDAQLGLVPAALAWANGRVGR